MLLAQVGMADGDLVTGVLHATVESMALWTSVLGAIAGLLALATSMIDRRRGCLILFLASGTIFSLPAYCLWWWSLEVLPTAWPFFLMAVGGALSGVPGAGGMHPANPMLGRFPRTNPRRKGDWRFPESVFGGRYDRPSFPSHQRNRNVWNDDEHRR